MVHDQQLEVVLHIRTEDCFQVELTKRDAIDAQGFDVIFDDPIDVLFAFGRDLAAGNPAIVLVAELLDREFASDLFAIRSLDDPEGVFRLKHLGVSFSFPPSGEPSIAHLATDAAGIDDEIIAVCIDL